MSYVNKVLHPDERVIAIGRKHWIIYLQGTLIVVVGIAICAFAFGVGGDMGLWLSGGGLAVAVFGLLVLLGAWIDKWTTEIAVTSRRVIQKTGLIRRNTSEMNMDKVESVLVNQSLFGRLFDYGSIVVRGTGAGMEGLHFIGKPIELRSAIVVADTRPAAPATPVVPATPVAPAPPAAPATPPPPST